MYFQTLLKLSVAGDLSFRFQAAIRLIEVLEKNG